MIPHIHRRSFGNGERVALAIHCTLAHSGAWRSFGDAVGQHVTLHAFDLPNHGRSGDWDGAGDLHDTATAMAHRVLHGIPDVPIDIIGHSFGGTVALRLAVDAPDRVRSLTMFEPVYFAPAMTDDPDFARKYCEISEGYDAAMAKGDTVAATQSFMSSWGGGTPWEQIPAQTRDYMVARIGFVRDSAPFVTGDSARLLEDNRLARVACPCLLMRGARSASMAPVIDALAKRLPNAHALVIPGSGHMAPVEEGAKIASYWRDFIEQV